LRGAVFLEAPDGSSHLWMKAFAKVGGRLTSHTVGV
jgi:hypothetical protein